jgi:hypothetical protein
VTTEDPPGCFFGKKPQNEEGAEAREDEQSQESAQVVGVPASWTVYQSHRDEDPVRQRTWPSRQN